MKVEVKDETSGATLVLPVETTEAGDGGELLAVVDVDSDGTVLNRSSQMIGPDTDDDYMPDTDGGGDVGKENTGKVSVVKTDDPNNPTEFRCENCSKVFKFIDSYWKHAKKCGKATGGGGRSLTAEQAQMMVTLKGQETKNTCSNCGRDFFHEVRT